MILLTRIVLIDFGVFLACLTLVLARQVVRDWRWSGLFVDEWLLAAGATALGGVYAAELVKAKGGLMPGVSWLWVAGIGALCSLHVGMKAARMLRKR